MNAVSELPAGGIASLVTRHGVEAPGRTALVFPHGRRAWRSLDYGTLRRRVAAVAAGLAKRGVRRGDRVAVFVPMSPELYVTLLAVVSLGAVAVFVEPSAKLAEFARAVRTVRPRAFIGIARAHVLRALYRDVAAVPVAIAVASAATARALGAESLAAVELDGAGRLDKENGQRPALELSPDAPALLTFSSGSTGAPKGATRSHEFLLAQHRAIDGLLRGDSGGDGSTGFGVDMSAFAIVLLSSLVRGNTAVIPRLGAGVDDIDGPALADAIERFGVSVVSGSPAFLAPIVDAARRRGAPLRSVRRMVTGGAPVPLDLCDAAEAALGSATLLVVYGSTEAEPIATIDAAEIRGDVAAATRRGRGLCVGYPHVDIDLELAVPSLSPLQVGPGGLAALAVRPGEIGEVVVAGDHVNERYYRDPVAERANKIVDERGRVWHRTGDAAYRDDHGRLWIVGRVADVVTRGDEIYHPAAVEAAAQTLPGVGRAALIADGDEVVVVVERRGRGPSPRAVVAHLADAGVRVDRARLTRSLPVDPRHRAKLDYPAIRRRYGTARRAM